MIVKYAFKILLEIDKLNTYTAIVFVLRENIKLLESLFILHFILMQLSICNHVCACPNVALSTLRA